MPHDESQLSEIALKEKLLALGQNDFHLSGGEDGAALIPAMLRHIGSIDSALRDDLIYSAFYTWMVADRCLDREQMRFIAQTALDERHLFYGLGERESDSVFTRTFSVLLLPLVLFRHRAQPLFSPAEVLQLKERLLRYLREEKDRRGFVEGKGWAHGVAHCADALDELAQCGELGAADLMEILRAVQSVVCCGEMIYSYGEEERLATAVVSAIGRQLLPVVELSGWIQAFAQAVSAVDAPPRKLIIRSNVKNFLQSLFFRLRWARGDGELSRPIEQALYQINPYLPKDAKMNEVIQKLKGANIDIDLATPADRIAWKQDPCPWNQAENTLEHHCAVKNTSICQYFCGLEYLDTLLCCYPHPNPLAVK